MPYGEMVVALSRDEILSAKDARLKEIEIPQWGGSVMIKTMTAGEKGKFEQKMLNKNLDYSKVLSEYAAIIVCDEEGNSLFTPKDIEALANKSSAAMQKIFDAGQELNNVTQDDIETLAGNS